MHNHCEPKNALGRKCVSSLAADHMLRHVIPEEQVPSNLQGGKDSDVRAVHDPRQADFLQVISEGITVCSTAVAKSLDVQVMQDVTGRFIANAAAQLRKRAASLCYEELKEYKVSPQERLCIH